MERQLHQPHRRVTPVACSCSCCCFRCRCHFCVTGDAADQLARENLKQLDEASATLGQQLPAFPEVARSLKTQVAARFLLAKHREFVEELYLDGFIQEKVWCAVAAVRRWCVRLL